MIVQLSIDCVDTSEGYSIRCHIYQRSCTFRLNLGSDTAFLYDSEDSRVVQRRARAATLHACC